MPTNILKKKNLLKSPSAILSLEQDAYRVMKRLLKIKTVIKEENVAVYFLIHEKIAQKP
jgi:hypothetical protein